MAVLREMLRELLLGTVLGMGVVLGLLAFAQLAGP